MVIPVSKPGKDHSNPLNYCTFKFERISKMTLCGFLIHMCISISISVLSFTMFIYHCMPFCIEKQSSIKLF